VRNGSIGVGNVTGVSGIFNASGCTVLGSIAGDGVGRIGATNIVGSGGNVIGSTRSFGSTGTTGLASSDSSVMRGAAMGATSGSAVRGNAIGSMARVGMSGCAVDGSMTVLVGGVASSGTVNVAGAGGASTASNGSVAIGSIGCAGVFGGSVTGTLDGGTAAVCDVACAALGGAETTLGAGCPCCARDWRGTFAFVVGLAVWFVVVGDVVEAGAKRATKLPNEAPPPRSPDVSPNSSTAKMCSRIDNTTNCVIDGRRNRCGLYSRRLVATIGAGPGAGAFLTALTARICASVDECGCEGVPAVARGAGADGAEGGKWAAGFIAE
jgi:hypothetical protein